MRAVTSMEAPGGTARPSAPAVRKIRTDLRGNGDDKAKVAAAQRNPTHSFSSSCFLVDTRVRDAFTRRPPPEGGCRFAAMAGCYSFGRCSASGLIMLIGCRRVSQHCRRRRELRFVAVPLHVPKFACTRRTFECEQRMIAVQHRFFIITRSPLCPAPPLQRLDERARLYQPARLGDDESRGLHARGCCQ